jgi:Sulfotransferase family
VNGPHLPPPIVVLAAPRSFSSLFCAMLGQHPEMYGLPETHLFRVETVRAWIDRAAQEAWPMEHGLLRAVAELHFGAQDDEGIQAARRWLAARADLSTRFVLRSLADRVFPQIVVEKSPSTGALRQSLLRTRRYFPKARYLHLVRHPRGFCESVFRLQELMQRERPVPASHWIMKLPTIQPPDAWEGAGEVDPQGAWYRRNRRISNFLETVPPPRRMLLRGEELLSKPDEVLYSLTTWLGLRNDAAAIAAMQHPECSPYASFGPVGARYGNDRFFLENPVFQAGARPSERLAGALPWRTDGRGFTPSVTALAREFGYH